MTTIDERPQGKPLARNHIFSKAVPCLSRAVELDADNVSARVELARAYRNLGHPEDGLPLLRQAVTIAERRGRCRRGQQIRALLAGWPGATPDTSPPPSACKSRGMPGSGSPPMQ